MVVAHHPVLYAIPAVVPAVIVAIVIVLIVWRDRRAERHERNRESSEPE
jgi:hypothetical protein